MNVEKKLRLICWNTNDVYLGHMTNLYDQGHSKKGAALKTQDTIFSNSLTTKSNMSLKRRIQTGATSSLRSKLTCIEPAAKRLLGGAGKHSSGVLRSVYVACV
ncbi:hypothetical protein F8388_016218 [Cannabis sativa]|uniref:Uncharacterized protein n=1 Tax=Cannabis sativa TaxID=3483 RepID=A0A7J6DZN4_CANSA|nr:hypothetical protein F8388_016218 [Cannabis sativa]